MQRVPDGILVSLKTSVSGGVTYTRRDLEEVVQGRNVVSRWETTKLVRDQDELRRATEARNRASYTVRRVCTHTSFGLVCPASRAADLDAAIVEARRIAEEHNASARFSRVEIHVLCGRVDGSSPEAIRAIASELGEILSGLTSATERLDVPAMREAASRALQIVGLLPDDLAAEIRRMVDAARTAARAVKRGDAADTEPVLSAVRRIRLPS